MSEKKRHQNNTSNMLKANNLGTALFIFVVLTGAILWFSGNLHFGARGLAEVEVLDTGHGHEQESQTDELMCQEHGFPESQCTICNPDLIKSLTVNAGSTTDLRSLELSKKLCVSMGCARLTAINAGLKWAWSKFNLRWQTH